LSNAIAEREKIENFFSQRRNRASKEFHRKSGIFLDFFSMRCYALHLDNEKSLSISSAEFVAHF